jgi:hypothetical protein
VRRSARLLAPVSLLAFAAAAAAQTIATSPAPESVDVTVYRDPGRPADREPMLRWLNGYALISERRQVTIPAGESDIRFEGVAGGILPQSAIVTGLPEGIVERNRDAYLLSPATLLDRSLGRRVHLRRTSRATGEVREHEAIVRSGAGGALVLETEGGFEALRCTGLAESVVYDRVPPGLSARPTLSVRARSSQPVTATVDLSYLATGFDWQANYVATLSPEVRFSSCHAGVEVFGDLPHRVQLAGVLIRDLDIVALGKHEKDVEHAERVDALLGQLHVVAQRGDVVEDTAFTDGRQHFVAANRHRVTSFA